jgi:hypothetical protein
MTSTKTKSRYRPGCRFSLPFIISNVPKRFFITGTEILPHRDKSGQ